MYFLEKTFFSIYVTVEYIFVEIEVLLWVLRLFGSRSWKTIQSLLKIVIVVNIGWII